MENLFKCDQCENSFTEDRMTTTGGDEIYCQKCWLEKGEEEEKEDILYYYEMEDDSLI